MFVAQPDTVLQAPWCKCIDLRVFNPLQWLLCHCVLDRAATLLLPCCCCPVALCWLLLPGYLMGVPVTSYSVGIGSEHVEFAGAPCSRRSGSHSRRSGSSCMMMLRAATAHWQRQEWHSRRPKLSWCKETQTSWSSLTLIWLGLIRHACLTAATTSLCADCVAACSLPSLLCLQRPSCRRASLRKT